MSRFAPTSPTQGVQADDGGSEALYGPALAAGYRGRRRGTKRRDSKSSVLSRSASAPQTKRGVASRVLGLRRRRDDYDPRFPRESLSSESEGEETSQRLAHLIRLNKDLARARAQILDETPAVWASAVTDVVRDDQYATTVVLEPILPPVPDPPPPSFFLAGCCGAFSTGCADACDQH